MITKDPARWAALTRLAWDAGNESKLRRLVQADGPANPVGAANAKTATASTYRPVGATCPSSCPQFPREGVKRTCLALSGNVQWHQVRASALAAPSLRSVVVALVQAARWGNPARLNVSGDFSTPTGGLDEEFLEGVHAIAETLQGLIYRDMNEPPVVIAWGYTHVPAEQFGDWRTALARVGVVIRYSGVRGPWGAVVYPGPNPAAKAREIGATYCPDQAAQDQIRAGKRDGWSGVTCMDCRLCWERDRAVLFRSSNNTVPVEDGTQELA